jgi:hypothetical protein
MFKNSSPSLLMLCSGLVSLSLLSAANPAFAKSNNAKGNSTPPTTTTPTTTAAPTQAATPATSSFTVGFEDLGKIFRVNFDGNVGTQNVSGLSSFADLKFLGFTTSGSTTIAKFDVVLDNTSGSGILSRVSGLGFNTNQTLLNATSATGVFDQSHLGGSFPNQFGNIDVCFNSGSNCQGGSNGGVSNSSSVPGTFDVGNFSFSLAMSGAVNSLSLSNFGVRYQSIDGTTLGTSGTGRGVSVTTPPITTPPLFDKPIDGTTPNDPTTPLPPTTTTPPKPSTPKPTKVPEPGTIAALALVSTIAIRYRKQRDAEAEI